MEVAVPSPRPTLDDRIDERLGRAMYLLIIETQTMRVDVFDNTENRDAMQGAGTGAAEAVAERGAHAVITGHLGPKAFRALSAVGIAGYDGSGMTVSEALSAFEDGTLESLSEAEAHSGMV